MARTRRRLAEAESLLLAELRWRGCVSINRDGERGDAPAARELPDLARLPDALGELVP